MAAVIERGLDAVKLVALLTCLCSGCVAAPKPPSTKIDGLTNRVWALSRLDGRRVERTRRPAATIRLRPDHAIVGALACNHVGGAELEWAGDPHGGTGAFLRHPGAATIITAAGCGDPLATEIGGRFWAKMPDARTWSVEGPTLTIRFGDGSAALLRLRKGRDASD